MENTGIYRPQINMLWVIFFPQVIFSFLLLLWMVMSVKQRKTSITTKES